MRPRLLFTLVNGIFNQDRVLGALVVTQVHADVTDLP
jgi:hypothetical protein